MTLPQLFLALAILVAFLLLNVYFFYTLYAVFRGAVFIPTPSRAIRQMLKLSRLGPEDRVLDFGSGDGRILLACAPHVAKCVGIEINILLVWISRLRGYLSGNKNIEIRCQDFWNTDLQDTDLLIVFLVPIKMDRLKKKVQQEMKPGSRVVSYRYTFPDWPHHEAKEKVFLYQV